MTVIRIGAFIGIVLASCLAIAASGAAQLPTPTAQQATSAAVTRQLPPQLVSRNATLMNTLQPSARQWVVDQARAQSRLAQPDPAAVQAAARARFSKPPAAGAANSAGNMSGMDVEVMVQLVMSQVATDAESDLKAQAEQMQEINKQKAALRTFQDALKREQEAGAKAKATDICHTPGCQGLASEAAALSRSAAAPVRLAVPPSVTYGALSQLEVQAKKDEGSLSDMGQEQQLKMQMVMDRMTKADNALSNIMKKTADAETSIVSKMK